VLVKLQKGLTFVAERFNFRHVAHHEAGEKYLRKLLDSKSRWRGHKKRTS